MTDRSADRRHVVVVGGGPAGLAAALAAADAGARVTLLEAGSQLGGQFWRHLPEGRDPRGQERLHHGWSTFQGMLARARDADAIELRTETSVWAVAARPGDEVGAKGLLVETIAGPVDGTARSSDSLRPDALVIATGAHDRTLPFPGWELPGVYTGGAAQALAKSERLAIGRRVVVAGAGPFLLPVAASLSQVGARVVLVAEAGRAPRLVRGWLPRPWQLARVPHKLTELLQYVGGQIAHRIPYLLGHAVVRAEGRGSVERVVLARVDAQWRPIPGTERVVACDAVCVTHGFTPRLEAAIAAGCALDDDRFVVIDEGCRTSVPEVYAAGEITGIGGVDLALAEGAVAGHCAAGGASADAAIARAQRARAVFSGFADRIEAAHGIRPGWQEWVTDDTVVCRCEEVSAGELRRKATATGSASLRSQKLSTRAGLGICQGRMCGRSVEQLLATRVGVERLDGGRVDRRPIHAPIRLGELAGRSGPSADAGPNTVCVGSRPTRRQEGQEQTCEPHD